MRTADAVHLPDLSDLDSGVRVGRFVHALSTSLD
jgi:hypothetical protein